MTNKVDIFNRAGKMAGFGNAKNSVPFAVSKMLSERGVFCRNCQNDGKDM